MTPAASHRAPIAPMTSKIVSMLATPKVPPPHSDSLWFYGVLVLIVIFIAVMAVLISGVLN